MNSTTIASSVPIATDQDAAEGPASRGRHWLTTGVLVAVLLAYANGSAWRATRCGGGLVGLSRAHVAMLGLILLWAKMERLPWHELGLRRQGLRRSVLAGVGIGAVTAIPIRTFFSLPGIAKVPVAVTEYQGLGRRRWLSLLCGQMLIGSALFEEVAFRGLLHAKLVRLVGPRPALLIGSAVFAAWHLVIAWYNVRRTNVSPRWFAPLYGVVLTILFGAGYVFGVIRNQTGHVGGSVVSHWMVVGQLLFEVARLGGADASCPASETASELP